MSNESRRQSERTPQAPSWNPTNWFRTTSQPMAAPAASAGAGCPVVKHDSAAGCPVDHKRGSASPPFQLPPSLEESAKHAQSPHPDQRIALSTHRVISNIPRANNEAAAPLHQAGAYENKKWVYPSEQQFYNAMRKKGWHGIQESSMPLVVKIHNAVNERAWRQVRRWELELHGNDDPKLVKFLGKPKEMSPKALINIWLLWYSPPFDRHDWYVDRGDGKEPRRYVIDFYNGSTTSSSSASKGMVASVLDRFRPQQQQQQQQQQAPLPSMYLDVRPAIDSPQAVSDRLKMCLIDAFPGLYAAAFKQQQPPALSNTPANLKKPNKTTVAEPPASK